MRSLVLLLLASILALVATEKREGDGHDELTIHPPDPGGLLSDRHSYKSPREGRSHVLEVQERQCNTDQDCVASATQTSLPSDSVADTASFISAISVSVLTEYKYFETGRATPTPQVDKPYSAVATRKVAGAIVGGVFLGLWFGWTMGTAMCGPQKPSTSDQYSHVRPATPPPRQPTPPEEEQHRFPEGGYGADGR